MNQFKSGLASHCHGVGVRSIIAAVPGNVVPNSYFSQGQNPFMFFPHFTEREVDAVTSNTGVAERRWCSSGQDAAHLCGIAARHALGRREWDPDTIDALVLVTQTPRFQMPATACELAALIGMRKNVAAFDVNLACSGYVYGLWLAHMILMSSEAVRVMLLAGDQVSSMINMGDRATALLFGDAGTCTLLERDANKGAVFILGTDGSGARSLMCGTSHVQMPDRSSIGGIVMDGAAVLDFTQQAVPQLYRDLCNASRSSFDHVVFHQASEFIIKRLTKKLELDHAIVPMNMQKFGNTSSASIPLVIADKLNDPLLRANQYIALLGFGAGFSWGAASIKLDQYTDTKVFEVTS